MVLILTSTYDQFKTINTRFTGGVVFFIDRPGVPEFIASMAIGGIANPNEAVFITDTKPATFDADFASAIQVDNLSFSHEELAALKLQLLQKPPPRTP